MAFRIISARSLGFSAALYVAVTAFALIMAAPAARAQVPAQPDAVSITAVGDGRLTLQITQNDSTDFDHFVCETSPPGPLSWSPATCTTVGGTPPGYTVEVTGLTNGTIYRVQVAAASASNAPSAPVLATESARPVVNQGPDAPTGGSATSSAAGSLSITWTAPTNFGYGDPLATAEATSILRYEYRRKESSNPVWGGGWSPVAPTPSDALLELSGLTSTTDYDVEIRAVNNLNQAGPSFTLNNLLPSGPPPAPVAASIPTLGEWGVVILSLLLIAGVVLSRRRFG